MSILIDLSDVIIENERFKLRLFNKDDLLDFFEYASVAGVGEQAGWKHHETLEDTIKVLNVFIKEKNVFAIYDKTLNKVIGSYGFNAVNPDLYPEFINTNNVEIGYCLSKKMWNQGIMSSLTKMILDFLKNRNFDYILVRCYKYNVASKRVIDKNGFIQYKEDDLYYFHYLDNKA